MSPPEDESRKERGFLRGWSERKLAAKRQEAAHSTTALEPEDPLPEDDRSVSEPDMEAIADLPAIEDITATTDLTPFMQRGVPATLRNAAMRKMWTANPLIRDHIDPALDYAWDWNAPGGVPGGGGSLTTESVSKMVKDLLGDRDPDEGDMPSGSVPPVQGSDPTAVEPDTAAPVESVSLRAPGRSGREEAAAGSVEEGEMRKDAQEMTRSASTDMEFIPIRRHGGALPD